MEIFYVPEMQDDAPFLNPAESSHCIRVLRHQEGDVIRVVDGKGGMYTAKIVEPDPKKCGISILSKLQDPFRLPYELHIAIAPTKNADRFEWFVEKATEIGITSITPLLCQRSERKHLRTDRLEKVAVAAMKQSGKASKPEIGEMMPFTAWLNKKREGLKMIAHCLDQNRTGIWKFKGEEQYSLLIGPEGDFTVEEIEAAQDKGYKPISLGDARLRTETAGIVACSAIYFSNI